MHSIDYSYSIYAGKKVPLIPLNIKGKDEWYEIWAFVDSGATYSVFKAKEAERLEIDIYNGKEMMVDVFEIFKVCFSDKKGIVSFSKEV